MTRMNYLCLKYAERSRRTLSDEVKYLIERALGRTLKEITMLLKGEDLSGVSLVIIDNFAEKNVVFRPAGVRRFELKKAA